MAEGREFIQSAKESLKALSLESVAVEESLQMIETDGGRIDLEVYKADKIEKVIFCTIKIFQPGISEKSVLIWPEDGYDIPLVWCNLTQMPGMNVPILDLIPIRDIVLSPDYARRYMTKLKETRDKSLGILGDTVTDKAFDLSSIVSYALSPYKIIVVVNDEGAGRVGDVMGEYAGLFTRFWQEAERLDEETLVQEAKNKKEAVRKLMKGNDPGYPFMLKIFGEDNTHRVFDIIF